MNCLSEWIESGEAHSRYERTDALTHPLAPIARRFWDRRPSDGIVIGRDIPSRSIARLLSHIIIYQPIENDLRVHLAGSAIRRRFARDITGLKMSELFVPNDFPVRYRTIMEAFSAGEPRYARISHSVGEVDVLRVEIMMLPAWSPDHTERWGLVFCFYL